MEINHELILKYFVELKPILFWWLLFEFLAVLVKALGLTIVILGSLTRILPLVEKFQAKEKVKS